MGEFGVNDVGKSIMTESIYLEDRFRYDCSGNWYKGSVHVHTTNGSGRLALPDAAKFYADAGYDFICVTDKRVPVDKQSLGNLPLLVIDGMELEGQDDQDTYYHVVCLGGVKAMTDGMPFMEAMNFIRSQDGILIWAHPRSTNNTPEHGERHHFDGMEVYNHTNHIVFGAGLADYHWDTVLEQQPNLLGFATDDAHFHELAPGERGGWIMVNAPELTESAILSAIRKGNFYSSTGPEFKSITIEKGNRIVIESSPVVFYRMTGHHGKYKYKGTGKRTPLSSISFRIPDVQTHARLEIEDENGKIAWSNPLLIAKD